VVTRKPATSGSRSWPTTSSAATTAASAERGRVRGKAPHTQADRVRDLFPAARVMEQPGLGAALRA
jgi:hypothetical protein